MWSAIVSQDSGDRSNALDIKLQQ